MNGFALGVFVVSATALLGSPGPGIAALLAIGRQQGVVRGLPYYAGLQVGLALAAALSAAGLMSVWQALPTLTTALGWAAVAYLLWLAWRIATAPVGIDGEARRTASSAVAGFVLGTANPKALLAFASLFASRSVVADARTDLLVKWLLCVAVMLVVDLAWLMAGAALRRAPLGPRVERSLNVGLAAMLMGSAVLTFPV